MNTDIVTSAVVAIAVVGFMIQTFMPAERQALATQSDTRNFLCDDKIKQQRLKVRSVLSTNTNICETRAGQQPLAAHPTVPA